MNFNIGNSLKEIRTLLGLTQKEVSKNICDQTLISRIEKGKVIPSAYLLTRISNRLGVNINDLIEKAVIENTEYVKEVENYVNQQIKKKDYKSLKEFIRLEKANPLFHTTEGERYFLWIEGICSYYLDKNAKGAIKLLLESLSKKDTTDKASSERDINIINSLAVIYGEEKQFEASEKLYEKIINQISRHPSLDYKLTIKIYYNYSKILTYKKHYDKGNSICDLGINFCRRNELIYLLGNLYYQKGYILDLLNNLNDASDSVKRAISIFEIENNSVFTNIAKQKLEAINKKINENNKAT